MPSVEFISTVPINLVSQEEGRLKQDASVLPVVQPHTLVYLSCGWEALRSEIDLITYRGTFKCGETAPIDIGSDTPSTSFGSDRSVGSASDLVHHHHDSSGTSSMDWRLCHAESFLFFPGTDSIETLCVFVRGDINKGHE